MWGKKRDDRQFEADRRRNEREQREQLRRRQLAEVNRKADEAKRRDQGKGKK